jgi:hypothetical protein
MHDFSHAYVAKSLLPAQSITANTTSDAVDIRAGEGVGTQAVILVDVGSITDAAGVNIAVEQKPRYGGSYVQIASQDVASPALKKIEIDRFDWNIRIVATILTPGTAPSVDLSVSMMLVGLTHGAS